MILAAYLRFLIDDGINFSSIAILRMKRFLSALVCLVVTELVPSVSPLFFLLSSRDPLGAPSLESSSSLCADLDSLSSSSSSSSSPPLFVDPPSTPVCPSSLLPLAVRAFFYCLSCMRFSFLFFFPIISPIL